MTVPRFSHGFSSYRINPIINSKVPSNEASANDSTPKLLETAKTNATLWRSVISQKKHEKATERQANEMIANAVDVSNIIIA
jgi:hypothetical protein